MSARVVVAHVDGSCPKPLGPGGWGAVLAADGEEPWLAWGRSWSTTNNRMEMSAAIGALEATSPGDALTIVSDSQYLVLGVTTWIDEWFLWEWRSRSGRPVENRDLWERLVALLQNRRVSWEWVKGHAGHEGNVMADALAAAARMGIPTTHAALAAAAAPRPAKRARKGARGTAGGRGATGEGEREEVGGP